MLAKAIPRQIELIEEGTVGGRYVSVPVALSRLGVRYLYVDKTRPGEIRLAEVGWSPPSDRSPSILTDFVAETLARESDVVGKLLCVDAPQRHVFIWLRLEAGLGLCNYLGDRATGPPWMMDRSR